MYPLNRVWTIVEGDDGNLWALTGYHVVNRLHYVITEEEWTEADSDIDYRWWVGGPGESPGPPSKKTPPWG